MFKTARYIIFIIMMLQMIIIVQSQSNLMSLTSHPSCDSSCWMGIEPGITTEAEVESILDSHNLSYEKHPLGAEGSTSYFYAISEFAHPLLLNNSTLIHTYDEIVTSIDFLLQSVEINDLMAEFGNPTHILQVGESYMMIYDFENLAFGVIEADQDHIFNLSIMSDEILNLVYIDSPRWDELENCTDSSQLCDVVNTISSLTPGALISLPISGNLVTSQSENLLLTIDTSTGNIEYLTLPNGLGLYPAWHPTENKIAYGRFISDYTVFDLTTNTYSNIVFKILYQKTMFILMDGLMMGLIFYIDGETAPLLELREQLLTHSISLSQ